MLVLVADDLVMRTEKVLRLTQLDPVAIFSFTSVDAVGKPTAVCMTGFHGSISLSQGDPRR